MIVKAWKSGNTKNSSYGIRIGIANRDLFFKKSWSTVTIEINGTNHICNITSGFWNKCPEIRDAAIKSWFKQNNNLTWTKGQPPNFNLVQVNGNHFQLY